MRKLLLILSGLLLIFDSFGQLSHNADTVIPVKYSSEIGHDSIFVIFGPGSSGFSDTLTLEASFPFGQKGTIQWYAIDRNEEDTTLVETLLTEHTDTSFFSYSTIFDGGYRVKIANGTYDTTITFWAYFNNLQVEPFYEKSCDELAIYGISGGVDFYYYNPDSVLNNEIIDNGYTQIWEDYYLENDVYSYVKLDSLQFDSLTTPANQANQYFSTPPIEYDNYMFTIYVEDSLGHKGSDTLYYEAIAVQVDFEVIDENGESLGDSARFSGPQDVIFRNLTENAEFYKWTFYNDTNRVRQGEDTIFRTSTFYEPGDPVTYTYPGFYDVKLSAEGPVFIENGEERSCVDSLRKPLYVTIYKSFVGELPDVVVPGRDDYKFYFKNINEWNYVEYEVPTNPNETGGNKNYRTVSIKNVEVYIYNRYGMRVFHYEGSNWTKEKGWDGTHNGQEVGSGVFYYWIRAWGLDNRLFQKKGFFHVFSGN